MKNLLFILTIIAFFSCDKSNEANEQVGEYQYNLDVALEFSVFNSQNEDLLNPENPNYINQENIELLYVIDGKTQQVYSSNLDYPKNFIVYKHANEYRIRIFPNYSETEEKPITYIQWSNSDTDKIEVVYERTLNAVLQRKIWLNGNQIWDWTENTDPYFIIVK